MKKNMIRALSENGGVVFCGVDSTEMVREMERIHKTSAVTSAALGRLLTAASMMGMMLKTEDASITLRLSGGGPAGTVLAVANGDGCARGYVQNPVVELPMRADGKMDVGGAVGREGTLSVVRDMGMKEPYVGQVALQTGEIGDDLTYYFATSEQIPSSVGLGVLMNKDNTVKAAGGFILQLMPFAPEELIDKVEKRIGELKSVTALIENGETPEQLLSAVLGDIDFEVTDTLPVEFRCDCSKERILKSLATLGKKDLDELIHSGEGIEVKCQFCNTAYTFSPEDLKEIRS